MGWAWTRAAHDWRAAGGAGRIFEVLSGLFDDLLEKILTIALFIFP